MFWDLLDWFLLIAFIVQIFLLITISEIIIQERREAIYVLRNEYEGLLSLATFMHTCMRIELGIFFLLLCYRYFL